jgi:23S rRNA (pseudouridine1915-N3)-methyltransferase
VKALVVWFGRPAASPYERQVAEYRKRVDRRWPAADRPFRPAGRVRDSDPRRALAAEAVAARRQAPHGWRLVALDEQGEALSSERFAHLLGAAEEQGAAGIVFVIGSDLGLDPELAASAWYRLSLGPMTLPHQLARLLLWEQLFRATQILGGGGYHRLRVQCSV